MTSRILASTNDAVKNLRENIPTIELPSLFPSSSSTSPSSASSSSIADEGTSSIDNLGGSLTSSPVVVITDDHQLLVYGSYADNSGDSVTDLIRIHYQLSVNWVRKNAVMVAVGVVALGIAVTVGTVAVRASRAHRQKVRKARVLRGKDGAKREVVVVTNVSTLEGVALALSLEQQGFLVFVGVPSQAKADEVEQWRRSDIHPVIVDSDKVIFKKKGSVKRRGLCSCANDLTHFIFVFFFLLLFIFIRFSPTLSRILCGQYPVSWIRRIAASSAVDPTRPRHRSSSRKNYQTRSPISSS